MLIKLIFCSFLALIPLICILALNGPLLQPDKKITIQGIKVVGGFNLKVNGTLDYTTWVKVRDPIKHGHEYVQHNYLIAHCK